MEPARWRQIEQLYNQASEMEQSRRTAFLRAACDGDDDLLLELEKLLAQGSGSFLEEPALKGMARDFAATPPASWVGRRIGNYKFLKLAGAGGMGEVYRAHDTKLKREVAIKILPDEFAGDPERVSRLQREAQLLASLNHPHIAAIYDLEEDDGFRFLILELVEGDTLAERLKRGPIPLDDALQIAAQIAEALGAAHERGILHRDLKPTNIKLTHEGKVKLLDFGLAKAFEAETAQPDPSQSPAMGMASTMQGVILGTAAYMSPEQAAGKRVDKRADIWAFGVVMWEMLTGERLFKGETVTHILASVLKEEPNLTRVPFEVRRLLGRCLERNPQKRLRDIGDAMVLLEEKPAAPARGWKISWIAAAALVTSVTAAGLWGWLKPGVPAEPALVTHFIAATPQGLNTGSPIVISPDGSHIAFTSGRPTQIFLRGMKDLDAKAIAGTENGLFPAFSPDGQWIAFTVPGPGSTQKLEKVPIAGGASQTVINSPTGGPVSWEADGTILLGSPTLRRLPERGGEPESIAKVDPAKGERNFIAPKLLPGGKHILASIVTTTKGIADFRIVAVDVKTGQKKTLLENAGQTLFAPTGANPETGHLLWSRLGSLFAASFNTRTLEVGPSVPVLEGLSGLGGLNLAAVSRTGTLAYSSKVTALPNQTLVWVNRQGTEQPLPAPALRILGNPQIAPNGRSVALSTADFVRAEGNQIWVYDLSRGATTRLTFENANTVPVWTPDSARLIYGSAKLLFTKGSLASVAADGSGQPLTLIPEEAPGSVAFSVSPDGKAVIGIRAAMSFRSREAWVLALEGAGASQAGPQPFLDNRFLRGFFQFSPNGKWVAYESNETGRNEIFVVPYPGPGGKSQVSIDGGTNPRWNRNGRELFFRLGDRMMAADVETGAAFRASTPKMLFEKPSAGYDVAPDSQRFLMLKAALGNQELPAELHVIVNWFDELRRLVPLPR